MDKIIRQAGPKDMPQVLDLIKELAAFEKEPDAVVITAEDLVKDGFGTNPLFTCFVAEVNGIIQGMALVYYRYSTWKGRTVHLEDLVVRQKMRGTGLGSALYKKVIEYSREQGSNPHCSPNVKKRYKSVKKRVVLGVYWRKKR